MKNSIINRLFLILICAMPFGHFLFRKADLWHAQGHFFQVGLLIIFCLSFFEKPKNIQILNKSLGIFTLWIGLITSYWWFIIFTKTQHYPLKIFLPFFNWLCFIWFYKLCLEYLNVKKIEEILKWFRYSIILLLFFCVLQHFNLDEFFKSIDPAAVKGDTLVGTIGNPSHLAGYLAIIQPIYFKKNLTNILSLILLWMIILLTNSASGVVIGLMIVLFWLFMQKNKIWALLGSIGVLGIISFIIIKFIDFFTFSGRIKLWQFAFKTFQNRLITGSGLGSFGIQDLELGGGHWRHTHCEPYQLIIEVGIIGFIFILWGIWEYFRIFKTIKTELTIKLASIFFGFCLLSLVTFSAHLWQMAIIGMMGYSFLYVIKNKELNKCALVLK